MRVFTEIAREKRLLNVARDVDLLFEALAFAFALDQARIVENAGGVGGQGVEDLAVEFRESRRTTRIQIEDAEKITVLDAGHGFLSTGAGQSVKRNHHYGAQALCDDALRGLQIHVGLCEVFGDDRGLLLQRELDGRLARCEAFGGKTESATASREFYFHGAGAVGL